LLPFRIQRSLRDVITVTGDRQFFNTQQLMRVQGSQQCLLQEQPSQPFRSGISLYLKISLLVCQGWWVDSTFS
jgi:hypothetical protein